MKVVVTNNMAEALTGINIDYFANLNNINSSISQSTVATLIETVKYDRAVSNYEQLQDSTNANLQESANRVSNYEQQASEIREQMDIISGDKVSISQSIKGTLQSTKPSFFDSAEEKYKKAVKYNALVEQYQRLQDQYERAVDRYNSALEVHNDKVEMAKEKLQGVEERIYDSLDDDIGIATNKLWQNISKYIIDPTIQPYETVFIVTIARVYISNLSELSWSKETSTIIRDFSNDLQHKLVEAIESFYQKFIPSIIDLKQSKYSKNQELYNYLLEKSENISIEDIENIMNSKEDILNSISYKTDFDYKGVVDPNEILQIENNVTSEITLIEGFVSQLDSFISSHCELETNVREQLSFINDTMKTMNTNIEGIASLDSSVNIISSEDMVNEIYTSPEYKVLMKNMEIKFLDGKSFYEINQKFLENNYFIALVKPETNFDILNQFINSLEELKSELETLKSDLSNLQAIKQELENAPKAHSEKIENEVKESMLNIPIFNIGSISVLSRLVETYKNAFLSSNDYYQNAKNTLESALNKAKVSSLVWSIILFSLSLIAYFYQEFITLEMSVAKGMPPKEVLSAIFGLFTFLELISYMRIRSILKKVVSTDENTRNRG
jgi:prefoldin subunit 5